MEINLSDIIHANISSLLNEGRLEDIKAKFPPEQSNNIDWLSTVDPSGNNKYLDWMAKMSLYDIKMVENYGLYYASRFKLDNSIRYNMIENIKYFHDFPHKYEQKDINQYKGVNDLDNATEIAKTKSSRKEMKQEGAIKVFEDEDFILIHPKTHEASCKYGSATRWCVTMKNHKGYFERYSTNGPLFFLIDKRRLDQTNSMRTPDYYKVALHYQPRFRGGVLHDVNQASRYARDMSKEDFVNTANRGNVRLDYWNVQDANVKESTVLKYLGGPGRGQKARGEATSLALKNAMEKYTKKILGDFWEKTNTEDNTSIETELKELNQKQVIATDKYAYYDDLNDYLYNSIGGLEELLYKLRRMSDFGVEDEDNDDMIEEVDSKLTYLRNKKLLVEEKTQRYSDELDELQRKITELQRKTANKFSFRELTSTD